MICPACKDPGAWIPRVGKVECQQVTCNNYSEKLVSDELKTGKPRKVSEKPYASRSERQVVQRNLKTIYVNKSGWTRDRKNFQDKEYGQIELDDNGSPEYDEIGRFEELQTEPDGTTWYGDLDTGQVRRWDDDKGWVEEGKVGFA